MEASRPDLPLSSALSLLWTIHSEITSYISKVRISSCINRVALKVDSYIYFSFNITEFLLCAKHPALL